MTAPFRRIAIVNRGEPAMRLLHAVAEINRQEGAGLRTIALYTEPDRHAWFVREADESRCIGPATYFDDDLGRRAHSYLDHDRLEDALTSTEAEAAWVGWGFVSEQADFAALCERLGVVFIGPKSHVIRKVGNKIEAKRLAESADVPVVPWSGGPVTGPDELRELGERLGYPLFVKAAAGGGGRGIRKVADESEIESALESARSEAQNSFGDPTVFAERQVQGARHVEVQVIADEHGTVWAPGVRDCTLQRRNQKMVEESACTVLDEKGHEELRAAATRLAETAGYTNAGTIEMLLAPEEAQFWFMEVNARLQVEHPVTELTTGLDLVKLQIYVARGDRLEGEMPPISGHAIEARLNAEDPDRGFAPAPGKVRYFRQPAGPGVRVDTGITGGDSIAPEFDSMVAKVLAWGRDREEARARLTRALAQAAVVVEGGTTNKGFLLNLLDHPDVVAGRYDTNWLDRQMEAGDLLERRGGDVALLAAAVEAYEVEHDLARGAFFTSARRGRAEVDKDAGQALEFRYRGQSYSFHAYRLGPRTYRVDTGDATVDLEVERFGPFERRVAVGGRDYSVVSVVEGPTHMVEVEGITHTVTREEGGVVRAPAPGVVLSIAVSEGDDVSADDALVTLESMKMETVVSASFAGRVKRVDVTPNAQVPAGAPLLQLEATGDDDEGEAEVVSIDFDDGGDETRPTSARQFEVLRFYLLGYDLDPATVDALVGRYRDVVDEAGADDAELASREAELLTVFADICAITRRVPETEEVEGELVRAPEEHLLTFVRSPERGRDTLPRVFLDRLQQVLSHYGIESLDPAPATEDALFWLYRSRARLREAAPLIEAILERRLGEVDQLKARTDDQLRGLLDRLALSAEGRYESVADLARDVRYRYFEQAALDQALAEAHEEMSRHLEALSGDLDGDERADHVAAVVDCPHPLRPLLLAWYRDGDRQARDAVLETGLRRYYRFRDLEDLQVVGDDGERLAVAEYDHEGKRIHVMVGYGPADALEELGRVAARHLEGVPDDRAPVLDVRTWRDGDPGDADDVAERVREVLASTAFGRPMHRVDVTVTTDRQSPHSPVTCHFTFRQDGDGFAEERLYRNLHPMLAKRLDIGMLQNFDIERLPSSAEEVYLFHGVARSNPKDERLFALIEVRDLTPSRDEEGRIVGLPVLERLFLEAVSGIRRFQSRRPPEKRLYENRVVLHVRPPWTVPPDMWRDLARRGAPAGLGLGIERVVVLVRIPDRSGALKEAAIHVTNPGARGVVVALAEPDHRPIEPLSEYGQKILKTRRRGSVYPYELVRLLTPAQDTESDFPTGDFVEHDLDDTGQLVPTPRPYGENEANLVVGVIRNMTTVVPEGMARVLIASDPTRSLGALAEPECRRIIAALELARSMKVPVEWFAVSSGAKISMSSGVENMDWIGAVLRHLVEFTQDGGEVNLVVTGINVGAQPYWNAEATMLMHTRGILVMMPQSAMVLTGKQALDFSGGVSAGDNLGIGGFERIMGPNGQGQYWARDLESACEILLAHYDHTYVVPGERFPRRFPTSDPIDRDVCGFPHPELDGSDFKTVGDIFSSERNPERKKAFDIRTVMRAVSDEDHNPLERWRRMRDADTAVVWDARIGGFPVCLLGVESQTVRREGLAPNDGPSSWTAGTLFPKSSKKMARAINAASGNRPVVVLANLSGFDGSPESMRELQLEFGAEIGRAVVNFRGPMVFVVISRYHGGAFVVFSKTLNDSLEVVAVEGSYASVIGGAPAAAVVFAREVDNRTKADSRVKEAAEAAERAGDGDRKEARRRLEDVTEEVRSAKRGEVAQEFDSIHSIHRAKEVGSVDRIIPAQTLRPYLVEAIERGMAREVDRLRKDDA